MIYSITVALKAFVQVTDYTEVNPFMPKVQFFGLVVPYSTFVSQSVILKSGALKVGVQNCTHGHKI